MKENCTIKLKACYFFIAIIIFSGILILYLSCESKSPIEPASSLHKQVAAQSTNNTTTSSSTTTIKPSNAPTNTSTIITSRTLTSTSIRKTTTSTSSTTSILPNTTTSLKKIFTTTSRMPSKTTTTMVPTSSTTSSSTTSSVSTTSTSTTSSTSTSTTSTTSTSTTTTVGTPNLSFCSFTIDDKNGRTQTISTGGTYFSYDDNNTLTIYPQIKNDGSASASSVSVSFDSKSGFAISIWDASSLFSTIPNDDTCRDNGSDTIIIYHGAQSSGSTCQVTIIAEGYSGVTFTFTIQIR